MSDCPYEKFWRKLTDWTDNWLTNWLIINLIRVDDAEKSSLFRVKNLTIINFSYLLFLRALTSYITAPDGCHRKNDLNDGAYDDQGRNSHHGFLLCGKVYVRQLVRIKEKGIFIIVTSA